MPELKISQLGWVPRGVRVLGPIDAFFQSPALVAVVGPNGGGKTSFLRALAGLTAMEGQLIWNGKPLPPEAWAREGLTSFLTSQETPELPWSLREVISLGYGSNTSWRDQVEETLGLKDALDAPFSELSQGFQTLGHLARLVCGLPPILLLDEPLAHLDWNHRARFSELITLLKEQGCLIFLSLHDPCSLLSPDRIFALRGGQCLFDGRTQDFDRNVLEAVWEPESERALKVLLDVWNPKKGA